MKNQLKDFVITAFVFSLAFAICVILSLTIVGMLFTLVASVASIFAGAGLWNIFLHLPYKWFLLADMAGVFVYLIYNFNKVEE
jgi:hypothetical protein